MTAWSKTRARLRPDTVARAVALCVDTRRGVLVVGPPGAGASQCAAEIAAGLRAAGVRVTVWDDLDRVSRNRAPRGGVAGGGATQGGATRSGAARGAGGPVRRVVPDGHVLVASARLGATLPPDDDDEVSIRTTRLPLRDLTRAESEAFVSSVVGIPVSARLVEVLWACSHGNVAALRASFDDLAARGVIRRTRDRMEMTVGPGDAIAEVAVDPRLWLGPATGAVGTSTAADADLAALTTAALARRVSLVGLVRLHGDDVVSDLIARGLLIARRPEGVEMLTVQPPVLASALRAGADHRQRRDVYEAVLSRRGAGPPDPRIVLWALEQGRAAGSPSADGDLVVVVDPRAHTHGPDALVNAATVLAAAHAALDGHDYRTGVDLHDAADRAGLEMTAVQRAELALIAGSSLRLLDRLPEAATLFEQSMALLQDGVGSRNADPDAPADRTDPAEPELVRVLVDLVTARADLTHHRERGPEKALPEIADAHRLLPPDHPAHPVLDALTVVHLTYSGRYRDAARAYSELGSSLPPDWGRRLEALHALALDSLGQSDAALAVLRRLARRARSMGHVAWASEEYLSALLSVVLHGFGITALGGELASFGAIDHVESVRIDHGLRRAVDAEIALVAGDLPTAVSAAADAIDTVEVDGPEEFLPRVLSLHALALALCGQAGQAREQLRRMRAMPSYTNSPVGPETLAAEAGVLFCLEECDEARRVVLGLVEDGLQGAAIRASLAGVLVGDAETCRIVGELAVTGDLPEMLQELAVATLAQSPRRLLEVARQAREFGVMLVAAAAADRARAVASPGSQHQGLAERMLATIDVRWTRPGASGLASPAGATGLAGSAGLLPPGVSLTRRESEIAGLVGQGLTNGEIANELHLSKRTVEGHLNRIYTKTGTRLRG